MEMNWMAHVLTSNDAEGFVVVRRPSGGSRGSRPWACPRGWEGEHGGSRMCGHRRARARGSVVGCKRRTCLHRGRCQCRALWCGQESRHRRTRGIGTKGRRRGMVHARDAATRGPEKGKRRHDQPMREGLSKGEHGPKRAPQEMWRVGTLALQKSTPLASRHPAPGHFEESHPGTLRGSLEGRRSLN